MKDKEEITVVDAEQPTTSDDVKNANTTTNNNDVECSSSLIQPEDEAEERRNVLRSAIQGRLFKFMARNPWLHLVLSFLLVSIVSSLGFVLQDGFPFSLDNTGWLSRGTLIADRTTQYYILIRNWSDLQDGDETAWKLLMEGPQSNFDPNSPSSSRRRRRRQLLSSSSSLTTTTTTTTTTLPSLLPTFWKEEENDDEINSSTFTLPLQETISILNNNNTMGLVNSFKLNLDNDLDLDLEQQQQQRTLLQESFTSCYSKYNAVSQKRYHLTSLWKTRKMSSSALDPSVIRDICEAELNTMNVLQEEGLCKTCDGACMPPISLVLLIRVALQDYTLSLSCEELAIQWGNDETTQSTMRQQLFTCVQEIKEKWSDDDFDYYDTLSSKCPTMFFMSIVDENFASDNNNIITYTSSIFPTVSRSGLSTELYEMRNRYDKAEDSAVVIGAYDDRGQSFTNLYAQEALNNDIYLASGSGIVTALAILMHTRSLWITIIGLFQIILSFPIAFTFYSKVMMLSFFPLLNFIGLFVVFALGADDIFVVVDKWKNVRLDKPDASTEDVAAVALPDAAGAMLLTTTTTAVAFFGTAVCPVAPLKCFGIFCGLLVIFDYILCVVLVFPALCIYDKWVHVRASNNICCSSRICCGKAVSNNNNNDNAEGDDANNSDVEQEENTFQSPDTAISSVREQPTGVVDTKGEDKNEQNYDGGDDDDEKVSFIRRILSGFYFYFHKIRWIVLLFSIVGIVVSGIFASRLELPQDSNVRLLTDSNEYEQNYQGQKKLLDRLLRDTGGSGGAVIWGLTPSDTGNYNDPESGSRFVLDKTFDPSGTENQQYMLSFCEDFFEQEFASLTKSKLCPLTMFHEWLDTVATNTNNDDDDGNYEPPNSYRNYCGDADGLPMSEEDFHPCLSAWANDEANDEANESILTRNGVVQIIYFKYRARTRFDDPFTELDEEWKLVERYMDDWRQKAPSSGGANKMYQTSITYWWYDTNASMLSSAYASAGIALGFSAFIVLLHSRSMTLTFFSLCTIGYVLFSTTAMLIAIGWTLGFLESICFAILIGLSCDFVIHFGHAYVHASTTVEEEEGETKKEHVTSRSYRICNTSNGSQYIGSGLYIHLCSNCHVIL